MNSLSTECDQTFEYCEYLAAQTGTKKLGCSASTVAMRIAVSSDSVPCYVCICQCGKYS